MGYTTDFNGEFKLNKPLDKKTLDFLNKFNRTRRMRRNVDAKYGVEGEFYVDGTGFAGQDRDATVIDGNAPPSTQPGLWCQWVPNEDGTAIQWDGGEKFYDYVAWLDYLITKILKPAGYKLTGEVTWQGEDSNDIGKIVVKNNKVRVLTGRVVYGE